MSQAESTLSSLREAELCLLIETLVRQHRVHRAQEDTVLVLTDIASITALIAAAPPGKPFDLSFRPSAEDLQNTRLLSLLLLEALNCLAPSDTLQQLRRERANRLREKRQRKRQERWERMRQLDRRIPAASFCLAARPAGVPLSVPTTDEFADLLSESRAMCLVATDTLEKAHRAIAKAHTAATHRRQIVAEVRKCREQRTQVLQTIRERNAPLCA